ncbi:MAG: MFS transporter [Chloroflexota bacterium]
MVGYGQIIRENRNFRNLWLGQVVSMFGDWFNLIASAALIALFTESGLAVGALFVVRMLAPFLASPIAGVVADRYNRKWILIGSDIIRSLTAFSFLFVREPQHVWLIYVLTIIQMGVSGFFAPTYNAFLPDIVTSKELGTANALSAITWSVMLAVGSAVGGLVSGVFGIYTAFTIDGFTFLLSIFFLMRMSYTPAPIETEQQVSAAIKEYIDGLKYLKNHADIFVIVFHKAFVTFTTWSGIHVVQVIIAEEIFVLGEGGSISLGLMFAFNGLGSSLGPVITRYWTKDQDRPTRRMITLSYLVSALGLAIAATLFNLPMVLLGVFLIGIGGGTIWVFSTQLLLQLLPSQMRGRVLSVQLALHTLFSAIAATIIGLLVDTGLTVAQILWGNALVALVPAVIWGVWLAVGQLSLEFVVEGE